MSLRNFLTLASIVAFAFGLAFVLIPVQLAALYNIGLNPGGAFVGQLFGALLIGFGLLNWLARDIHDAQGRRAVVLANLVGDAIGFVLALLGQLAGVGGVNPLGWSTVAIYLVLAVGWAYFQFAQPGAA